MCFAKKNLWFFWKIAKASKFTVKCNWIIENSQNFENLDFLIRKIDGFFEKLVTFYKKIAKSSKVALQGHWNCRNSQNVQKLVVFL